MGSDGIPAAGYRICQCSCQNGFGSFRSLVNAQECVSAGVEMAYRSIDTVESIVIPAFSVFCFMVDGRTFDLHFSGA